LFYENFCLRSKLAGVTCMFMNERQGVVAGHSPPRRGPVPKLLWPDLLLF